MYKRVLVAIDLSEEAHGLLEKAVELAKQYGAALEVVHVMDWPLTGFDPVVGYSSINDESLLEEMAGAVKRIVDKHNIAEANTHTLLGQPSSTVANLVTQLQADLLVVGSHGKRGWRALLGSTASAILQVVQCDCLVVRIKA
ncbi:MAG TPA: universal stress protein [Pseudomonadales bacterium]|nr:universal stress protein [Pseudomonadales bacterium]